MSNRAPGGFPQGYLGRSQNGTEFCWFPTINSWMVFKGKFCKIPRKKYSWMTTRTRKKNTFNEDFGRIFRMDL